MYQTIRYEKQENIGILTINRPEALNALNSTVIGDLEQAIAEVGLNRFTSGLYGKSLTAMINDEDAFVKRKLLKSAKPGQAQYEAIDRALYGPYVLPKEVMFYGRVRTTNNVWGTIGGHIFCYPNDYVMDKSDYR